MNPNLFLIASPRSGSTQLATWLSSHKQIALPPIKEPNFFAQHEFPPDYVAAHHLNDVDPKRYAETRSKKVMQFAIFREPDHYAYLFEGLTAAYRMDASTTYLHCPEAPRSIKDYAPDAKIILLTRDPVSRALSHYRLAVRTGRTTRTLREDLEAEAAGTTPLPGRFLLRQSRYDAATERYKDVFEEKNVLEIAFEDMIKEPRTSLKRVADFLEISSDDFDTSLESQNAGDSPRFKALNAWLMQSGIKTFLRQAVPVPAKRFLKKVYFKPNTESVAQDDIDLLRHYLAQEDA